MGSGASIEGEVGSKARMAILSAYGHLSRTEGKVQVPMKEVLNVLGEQAGVTPSDAGKALEMYKLEIDGEVMVDISALLAWALASDRMRGGPESTPEAHENMPEDTPERASHATSRDGLGAGDGGKVIVMPPTLVQLRHLASLPDWISRPDQHGSTPLHHFVHLGDVDTVHLLVQHGADLWAPGPDGRTALEIARDRSKSCGRGLSIWKLLEESSSKRHERHDIPGAAEGSDEKNAQAEPKMVQKDGAAVYVYHPASREWRAATVSRRLSNGCYVVEHLRGGSLAGVRPDHIRVREKFNPEDGLPEQEALLRLKVLESRVEAGGVASADELREIQALLLEALPKAGPQPGYAAAVVDWQAITSAAKSGNLEMLRELWHAPGSCDLTACEPAFGRSPLYYACLCGQLATVHWLVITCYGGLDRIPAAELWECSKNSLHEGIRKYLSGEQTYDELQVKEVYQGNDGDQTPVSDEEEDMGLGLLLGEEE
ncbi:unnamed protein product [Chrysoparadoxa australica]